MKFFSRDFFESFASFHFFVNFSELPTFVVVFSLLSLSLSLSLSRSLSFAPKNKMTTSAADLEALKAKLAEAVKKPITYSQLVPLQASLDAADAARYHDDGSLPETDNVALIDECYGKRGAGCWGRARQRSRVKRLQERRKSGSNRWGRRNEASSSPLLKKERKEDGVHSPCIFPLPRPESGLPLHERALLDAI